MQKFKLNGFYYSFYEFETLVNVIYIDQTYIRYRILAEVFLEKEFRYVHDVDMVLSHSFGMSLDSFQKRNYQELPQNPKDNKLKIMREIVDEYLLMKLL